MPQIRVKPNQMIELILQFEKEYEVYCDSITDGAVLVLFDASQRRLVVAHALPELKAVGSFLFTVGAFAESNEKVQCHLIGGQKSDEQLYGAFYGKLKEIGFQFKTAESNFENAFITIDQKAELQIKNIPSNEDQPDFPDFTDRKDDITDLLTDYHVIGAGKKFEQFTRTSMLATFHQPVVEDDDSIKPELPNPADLLGDPEWKETMAELDALMLEFDQTTTKPITASQKVLIGQATAIAAALPIYGVKPWQIVVVNLANGRKLQMDTSGGKVGLVVCDETSATVAACVLGTGSNMQVAISLVAEKCLTFVKTRSSQVTEIKQKAAAKDGKTTTQQSIVYHIAFDAAVSQATADLVKLKTEHTAKKLDLKVSEFAGALPKESRNCFLELDAGKFRITPFSKNLDPAYRAKSVSLTERRLQEVKHMERSSAEWIEYKDFIAVKHIPLIVELEKSCITDIDLSTKKAFIQLRPKTILFVAYCAHRSRGVFLQIETEEVKKYILNDKLTNAHCTMLTAMTNFPADDSAPPVKMHVFCREKTTGHANDATTVIQYIINFSKNYQEFLVETKRVFADRVGDSFELHRMSESMPPNFYSEKEISKSYLFWANGKDLGFVFSTMAEHEKGEVVIIKKDALQHTSVRMALEIKTIPNYKIPGFVADRKPHKTK